MTVGCPAKLAAASSRIQAPVRAMLWGIVGAMELREIELRTAMMGPVTYTPFRFLSCFPHGSKPETVSE